MFKELNPYARKTSGGGTKSRYYKEGGCYHLGVATSMEREVKA